MKILEYKAKGIKTLGQIRLIQEYESFTGKI